jgi:hypothetical protein
MRRAIACAARASTTIRRRDEAHVERSLALFTDRFFAAREGQGCPSPIRSSSSACRAPARPWSSKSSPAIPGSKGRWSFPTFRRWRGGWRPQGKSDDDSLSGMPGRSGRREARALGEEYLERTRIQRKTDRPYFIDKMPNNWAHVGLIRLILPEREDHRRPAPPARLLLLQLQAAFRPRPGFSYDLTELGAYYSDYVALMAHFDAVLPGPSTASSTRRLIEDPDGEVRAPARFSRPALRARLPRLPRECARRPHRELGAGPPADQPRGPGPVEDVRAVARAAQGGAGASAVQLMEPVEGVANRHRAAARMIDAPQKSI